MSEFAIIYGSLRGGIHLKPVTYKVMYLKLDTRTGHRATESQCLPSSNPKHSWLESMSLRVKYFLVNN